jgi:hypothetical protein
MTLDEAIKHCEEVAESKRKQVENGDWEKGSLTEHDCLECASEHKQLGEWLIELKKLREQTKWTPCSERLPKENGYVGDVCKYYLIQDEYGDMYVAHLSSVGWIPINSLKAISDEVIAWQPLPQPYKAEMESEE